MFIITSDCVVFSLYTVRQYTTYIFICIGYAQVAIEEIRLPMPVLIDLCLTYSKFELLMVIKLNKSYKFAVPWPGGG